MCLGVPGKVLSINGLEAEVDFFGVTKQLRLDIVDAPVVVGDYVLNHVGFAIRRIPHDEAQGTLALFEQILKEAREGDLYVEDIRNELGGLPAVKKEGA